jgi:hypothetical protein
MIYLIKLDGKERLKRDEELKPKIKQLNKRFFSLAVERMPSKHEVTGSIPVGTFLLALKLNFLFKNVSPNDE